MGNKLTIHSKRNTEESHWHKSSKYEKSVIENIEDPTGGKNINKLLTAVPSPFARMHLVETAFELALRGIQEKKETIFNKIVSETFDLLEILYNYESHKRAGANLSIMIWDFETHSDNLYKSTQSGHRELSEVLRKYFHTNERLKSMTSTYMFLLDNKVFGGSSPFTVVFTKGDIEKFNLKKSDGNAYFSKITPLWERDDDFLKSLYSMFNTKTNVLLTNSAKYVFRYLDASKDLLPISVKTFCINSINGIESNQNESLQYLKDESNSLIKVCGASIPTRANIVRVTESPLTIDCPHLPSYVNGIKPLVLREGRDSQGISKAGLKIPLKYGEIKEIKNRILPDNNNIYPYLVVDDFLEDHLVMLNYPINDGSFAVPVLNNIDKDNDNGFLLPIKKSFFDFFDKEDIVKLLTITKKQEEVYLVELQIPVEDGTTVPFKKFYYSEPKNNESGKLVNAKIYFAFFPLFKLKNNDEFNDFYKIMFTDDEPEESKVDLKFYDDDNNEISDNFNTAKHYKKTIRNKKNTTEEGSTYYQTNFPYKFLEIAISTGRAQRKIIEGMILPKWREFSLGNRKFDAAIDFGTTNSFAVILEDRSNEKTSPEPLIIGETDQQVILLNKSNPELNLTLTERFEETSNLLKIRLISRQKHEFIPSIIGAGDNPNYEFPIRTAISTSTDFTSGGSDLLGNINISFAFEKDVHRSDEHIQTNLKWEITEGENETKIREFLRQLLFMIRNKILLNQGNPKESNILWFKPLSMYEGHQANYKIIWDSIYKEIFKPKNINEGTKVLTESCAPYFYYTAQNKAQSTKPVLLIDIGGGSTDVSFFVDDKPQFGTSFNFAGNSIWNPGLQKKHQSLEGIFIKYGHDFITDSINKYSGSDKTKLNDLLKIYNSQSGTGLQSEDMVNFYFTWDKFLRFTDALKRDPKMKFLILFHFSSIVYHCIELLRQKGLERPKYLCLSGRGSKYLSILDPTPNFSLINGFLTGFINDIFGGNNNHEVKLERVPQEKEATCIGGLYLLADAKKNRGDFKDTPIAVPYLGEVDPQWKDIYYQDIDSQLKISVNQNIERFLELFFKQHKNYDFNNKFIITLDEDYNYYKDFCKKNSKEYLDLGLKKRMKNVKQTDKVNEPLFFYPIITMIYELSKIFYPGNSDN